MNKKGFTLVELLAVIVILGVILSLTIPNILNSAQNVKKDMLETKLELIEKQAEIYAADNLKSILAKNIIYKAACPDAPYGCVTVAQLVQLEYLEQDTTDKVTNPLSGRSLNTVKVLFSSNLDENPTAKRKRVFAKIDCNTIPIEEAQNGEESLDTSRTVCEEMHS